MRFISDITDAYPLSSLNVPIISYPFDFVEKGPNGPKLIQIKNKFNELECLISQQSSYTKYKNNDNVHNVIYLKTAAMFVAAYLD